MSVQALAWAFSQRIPPAQKIVLLSIANCADKNGDNAFPGQAHIADDASMGVRTVRRHIAWLEAKGYLCRVRRSRRDGSRTSDRYMLTMRPIWPEGRAKPSGQSVQGQAANAGRAKNPSEEPSAKEAYRKELEEESELDTESQYCGLQGRAF